MAEPRPARVFDRRRRRVAWLLAGAPLLACGLAAHAQEDPNFGAGANVSVRDRPHPEYEALGMRASGFLLYPQVELDGVFTDNVLATDTDAKSDFDLRVNPKLSVSSDWPRHALDLNLGLLRNQYLRFDEESTTDLNADATGRVDISRYSTAQLRVNAARLTEPRTAESTAVELARPIQYDTEGAYLSFVRRVGRMRLSSDLSYLRLAYQDGESLSGVTIDEHFRNSQRWSVVNRLDYALNPRFGTFVTASGNIRRFATPDIAIFGQDSSGYEAGGGVKVDLTHLVRGEVQVSYLHQDYRSPLFNTVNGPSFSGKLEWFATPLITVTAEARRTLEDSPQIGESGYLYSTFGLRVDHELLRNLILTARVEADQATFNGSNRSDSYLTTEARATFLFNRNVGAGLAYQRVTRNSSGTGAIADFAVDTLTLSLVLQH